MVSGIDGNMVCTWVNNLFSRLDTQNQGYIDKSNLQSALENISDSSADVEDIFTRLDGDNDGKVTKNEMTAALQNLFAQAGNHMPGLDGQAGGPGGLEGMPPPPPPEGNDTGFTKDELASQLEEIGSTDSKRSALISKIIDNFDEADSDGDGKVTFEEAMAYDRVTRTDSTAAFASGNAASETNGESKDAQIMKQIMQLLSAYQAFETDSSSTDATKQLSVTA